MTRLARLCGLSIGAIALLATFLVVRSLEDSIESPTVQPEATHSIRTEVGSALDGAGSRSLAKVPGDSSQRKKSLSDLPPKRQAWIRKNVESSLDSMVAQVTAISNPYSKPADQVEYLKLLRQVQIKQAMLGMLASDSVVLASTPPPKPDNSLRLMQWSFVNGRAKLADGSIMEKARLVYDLDLADHPAIVALDQELSSAERVNALDACYQFNSLDDATRKDRFEAHQRLFGQFEAHQKTLRELKKEASDYRARQAYLTEMSQTTWQDMGRLIPPNIAVNPRTLLASPRQ